MNKKLRFALKLGVVAVFLVLIAALAVHFTNLFSPSYTRVLVVGSPSEQLETTLKSQTFNYEDFIYAGQISPSAVVGNSSLDSFNVVIVSGERECDRDVRDALAAYVKNGGFLVLSGDACTSYAGETGWDAGESTFGGLLPVSYTGFGHSEGKLKIYDANHPLFNGIANFVFNEDAARVQLSKGAELLAFLSVNDSNGYWSDSYSPESLPLIVSSQDGRVYYFAFDLGSISSELLHNLLLESRA